MAGCVLHINRVWAGSQFRSRQLVPPLHRHGMIASMGRVGPASHIAAVESFFALL